MEIVDNCNSSFLGRSILATRLAFFIAGFSLATWAPLIPLAKQRLQADNGTIGLILLAFGIGSFLMMPLSGAIAARYGCRIVFTLATLLMLLTLPALTSLGTPLNLAIALFIFGASIGAMDVVVSILGVLVEKNANRPIMSSFHALFSIGGIAGSGVVSLLLIYGLSPLTTISLIVLLILVLLTLSFPSLLNYAEPDNSDTPLFVMPKGIVLLLGILCFIAYIMEGSMLDWSGILLTHHQLIATSHAGLGYMVFATAMTLGRLLGDRIISNFGRSRVFLCSALIATFGFVVVVSGGQLYSMMVGFFLIGAGLSNIVPMLFTAAGQQKTMPCSLAVASMSTIGYSGILLGPALIGSLAHITSLATAFIVVAMLSLSLPLCSRLLKK